MLIRNDLRSVAFPVAIENVQKNVAVDSFEAVRGFGGSGSGGSGSSGGKSKKGGTKTAATTQQSNAQGQSSIPAPAKGGATQLPGNAQQLPGKAPAPAVDQKYPAPAPAQNPKL